MSNGFFFCLFGRASVLRHCQMLKTRPSRLISNRWNDSFFAISCTGLELHVLNVLRKFFMCEHVCSALSFRRWPTYFHIILCALQFIKLKDQNLIFKWHKKIGSKTQMFSSLFLRKKHVPSKRMYESNKICPSIDVLCAATYQWWTQHGEFHVWWKLAPLTLTHFHHSRREVWQFIVCIEFILASNIYVRIFSFVSLEHKICFNKFYFKCTISKFTSYKHGTAVARGFR